MDLVKKNNLRKQLKIIRETNYQFIQFANSQIKSNHSYTNDEIHNFNMLEEHLTNMNLIFANMEQSLVKN